MPRTIIYTQKEDLSSFQNALIIISYKNSYVVINSYSQSHQYASQTSYYIGNSYLLS